MTEILVHDVAAGDIPTDRRVVDHPAWPALKNAVEEIRPWQSKDGSIDFDAEGAPSRAAARATLDRVIVAIEELSPLLPHDDAYHRALLVDLRRWATDGFGVPDFLDSLLAFQPPRAAPTGSSTWSSSRCTHRTATRTATSKRSCCGWSGPSGWPSSKPPATTTRCSAASPSRASPRDTTPTPPCSSRRPSPCARPPSASAGAESSVTARPPASAVSPRRRSICSASSCPTTSTR